MKKYFKNIFDGFFTTLKGMALTFKHLKKANLRRKPVYVSDPTYFDQKIGLVTLTYPHEKLPLPDNARHQLHNEIDDCIVCDKCAVVCPVNCITIDTIKSTEVFGQTSDGTNKRLYAEKFDIDMAKCCYCGLCTSVCPTECLTMTQEYDFSTFSITDMNFAFANLTEEEAKSKKDAYEIFMAEKAAAKLAATPIAKTESDINTAPKPAFKPKISTNANVINNDNKADNQTIESVVKPVFKPKIPLPKPKVEADINPDDIKNNVADNIESKPILAKPVFKPKIPLPKPKIEADINPDDIKNDVADDIESKPILAKPVFKPKIPLPKPKVDADINTDEIKNNVADNIESKPILAKPVFKRKENNDTQSSE